MAVTLTVSENIDGAAVADALAGGGTGVDLGSVVNGSYTGVIDKTSNTGKQDLYISHDAVVDPITDVGFFIQEFGTATGFSYGGGNDSTTDFTNLKSMGNASGSSKNNLDLLSGGLWIDMDFDSSDTTRFDVASFPTVVKIHGDNGTDGQDLTSAFDLQTSAMVYDAPGVTAATSPVLGQIGKAADTALGTNAKIQMRLMIPSNPPATVGGIIQWEWVIKYSSTS